MEFLSILTIFTFSDNTHSHRRSSLWAQAASALCHKPGTQRCLDQNWILTHIPPPIAEELVLSAGTLQWPAWLVFHSSMAACKNLLLPAYQWLLQVLGQEIAKCTMTVQGRVLFPVQCMPLSWCHPWGQGPCYGNSVCKALCASAQPCWEVQEQEKGLSSPSCSFTLVTLGPSAKGKLMILERS